MSQGKHDPAQLFGQMLTQWETMSNQFANSVMGTEQFGKTQGAAMAASLKLRETMHEQMSRFLEVVNLPSREAVTELREAVAKIDARLARIEAKLDGTSGVPATANAGPPRTRKPAKRQGKNA